ncbi:MAG: molybdopterin converting factor subunit 1 [Hydrotalea sp.]|nr:molybdopterin converting factor subunit 1 [Hydrotalea sp.]
MMIQVRYFSWVREKLQKDRETLELPANASRLQDVLATLDQRGGDYALLKKNNGMLRYALNYRLAKPSDQIKNGDEVAIFPPVTGG